MKLARTVALFLFAATLLAACGGRSRRGDSVGGVDSGTGGDGSMPPGDGSMPPGDGGGIDFGGIDFGTADLSFPDLGGHDMGKSFCGDFSTGPGEQCDSGGVDTDSCDYDCTFVMCGDFHTNSARGEACDDGPSGSSTCSSSCSSITPSFCGDGVVNAGEGCDDGSTFAGDGCSGLCTVESGWMCSGSPSFCSRTTGRTINQTSTPSVAIVDYATVATTETSTMSVTGAACTISSITVDVSITHTYVGDLLVELQSPGGAIVTLHNLSGGATANIIGNYPTDFAEDGPGLLSDLTGASGTGTWTMRVSDHASGDTGTFSSWTLHIICS